MCKRFEQLNNGHVLLDHAVNMGTLNIQNDLMFQNFENIAIVSKIY